GDCNGCRAGDLGVDDQADGRQAIFSGDSLAHRAESGGGADHRSVGDGAAVRVNRPDGERDAATAGALRDSGEEANLCCIRSRHTDDADKRVRGTDEHGTAEVRSTAWAQACEAAVVVAGNARIAGAGEATREGAAVVKAEVTAVAVAGRGEVAALS